MPTSLKKSSLVPDFSFSLLQLFTHVTVHCAWYLLRLNTLLVSVCSKDLLICFADHWRGEWDCCVGRHFHEVYNFFSTYYFFFLYCFLPTTFYPHPLPTPTTQSNPVGVDLFSYANTFFCVNKFAYMLVMRVKTLYCQ